MTNSISQNHFRILAIAPTTRGFGFAVLDGNETLVDWGVRRIDGKIKNTWSLAMVEKLVARFVTACLRAKEDQSCSFLKEALKLVRIPK